MKKYPHVCQCAKLQIGPGILLANRSPSGASRAEVSAKATESI